MLTKKRKCDENTIRRARSVWCLLFPLTFLRKGRWLNTVQAVCSIAFLGRLRSPFTLFGRGRGRLLRRRTNIAFYFMVLYFCWSVYKTSRVAGGVTIAVWCVGMTLSLRGVRCHDHYGHPLRCHIALHRISWWLLIIMSGDFPYRVIVSLRKTIMCLKLILREGREL